MHPLSTSNHNTASGIYQRHVVVLHPLSTSNHNQPAELIANLKVVLHPLSTSNHNRRPEDRLPAGSCIASSFYIKPQLSCSDSDFRCVVLHPLSTSNHNKRFDNSVVARVVLHPLSTSNHNRGLSLFAIMMLYCILFLHQTTTAHLLEYQSVRCIASSFYIKPQPAMHGCSAMHSCIASSFYIKPQPRTPDTLIFRHLTASRHDTKRGGVHRGSRFDAVFTFSTNIRKIIFTEIRRCMSVQRAGARLRSDSSEANI